jgi:hypothetical protein
MPAEAPVTKATFPFQRCIAFLWGGDCAIATASRDPSVPRFYYKTTFNVNLIIRAKRAHPIADNRRFLLKFTKLVQFIKNAQTCNSTAIDCCRVYATTEIYQGYQLHNFTFFFCDEMVG